MSKWKVFATGSLLALASISEPASAFGFAGSIVPKSVHAEGGWIYLFGSFSNPDKCATSDVLIINAANSEELARMTSMAITAKTTGKPLSIWVDGCQSVPWFPNAPKAYAMAMGDR
ncbi:hypothetical protein [Sphingomonas yabuuchiae]|uniref:hypothetical protein n=1 Tax=Sphingomonas yabuuchiae TaxID=172044 RepID=UPI000B19BA75|nr:hypothetical protein [Sphingomonas yabuuchiae]